MLANSYLSLNFIFSKYSRKELKVLLNCSEYNGLILNLCNAEERMSCIQLLLFYYKILYLKLKLYKTKQSYFLNSNAMPHLC